ncbi:MAG: choice-of-anchor J domain-containing protein, partial [Anaerolineae bacterium]
VSSDSFGAAPFDTEMRSTAFDLSGWLPSDELTLNYLANYQNYAGYDYLDLDISADGGYTWTNLLSWNEDHGGLRGLPGEAVSVDLSPYAGLSGLKLRWRYYDPNTGDDYDWYAQVDELSLSCVPQPVIEVAPDNLSSSQLPNQIQSQALSVSNVGRAELVWSIDEAATPTIVQEPTPSALDARQAPAQAGYSSALYAPSPNATLLDEGFEGGAVPPEGWTQVISNTYETWHIRAGGAHDGSYTAEILYDYAQDEWLVGPEMVLTEATLSLWSYGSLYWCRDTYDNCDLNVWLVVGDVGGGDDVFVGRADDDWTGTWVWSQSVFDLTPLLPAAPVRLGFQYSGDDGAQVLLDDIVLDGTTGLAECIAPVDMPWLSLSSYSGTTLPGESTALDVTFDSTGLPAGSYTGNLCVNSNDPATPLMAIPVELTVEPGVMTSVGLCTFDYDSQTEAHDFKLLFTPKWFKYKLSGSKPSQFSYNVFYVGDGLTTTIQVTVPYPFITQGVKPVRVYDDVVTYVNWKGQTCFYPWHRIASYRTRVSLGDHVDTDGDGKPDSYNLVLTDVPVNDGFVFVKIHMDYGLERTRDRYLKVSNPDGTNDAVDPDSGEVIIADRTPHNFWVQFSDTPLDGGAIVNINRFTSCKR